LTTSSDLQARITALTRDLILIPSTNARPVERERCFEFIQNHLDNLDEIQLKHYESNDYASLVVLPKSVDKPEILLCGHLDVIEHPDANSFHSSIRDGRIYGPGSGDMKGAIAIMLELFRTLHDETPGASLGIAITSDEEQGGANGVRFLCDEENLRCDVAIIPDGGSLNEVTIEEKGVLHLRVRRHGHAAHGARPWLATNAVQLLTDRLAELQKHFARYWPDAESVADDHWFATCALTILRTPNETPNRIPAEAEAVLDIRFPPPHRVESMLAEVADVLGPECELEPLMSAEPTHLDPDEVFCQVTTEVTGNPVKLVKVSGGSDGRFLRQFGIPVNLSRPLVGNLHAEDEWIDIASMVTYYNICETYVRRKLGMEADDMGWL